jgi:hypothetical protein
MGRERTKVGAAWRGDANAVCASPICMPHCAQGGGGGVGHVRAETGVGNVNGEGLSQRTMVYYLSET